MAELDILSQKIEELKNKPTKEEKIRSLEGLKKIFEGTGRRKYCTPDMLNAFYEEFDILALHRENPELAESLLNAFYQSRNSNINMRSNKVDFDTIVALYREFLKPEKMKLFESLLKDHQAEVTSIIDLDNTREILEFLAEKGILNNFRNTTLLKVTLYGKADYIKETVYPKVIANNPETIETFYEDDLASIWIKEKGVSSHKRGAFRRSRGSSEDKDTDTLYSSCHRIDYDEFWENIEILRANSGLFDDKFDIEDVGANLNIKTLPTWVLKKNIGLCKLFGLGTIASVPPSFFENGDIENKIHLAIELGLLNPPLTPAFKEMDKDIVRNEMFQRNVTRKGLYNQSIRNYFQRYISNLSNFSINEYAYLFYKLQNEGYLAFYNEVFSDSHAGKGRFVELLGEFKEKMDTKEKLDDFVDTNFVADWHSEFIDGYDEYDEVIDNYAIEGKKTKYEDQNYINDKIVEDPLIKELEDNNTVMDEVTQNDVLVERKNAFVYMFGDRIISRYKVLHNASILKETYGTLTREMLMASIVRNSFLDKETFQKIYSCVIERGKQI